jgi:hypothetical protein
VSDPGLCAAWGKPRGRGAVPSTLNEDVEGVAILIRGAPEAAALAPDLDEHLVEKQGVTRAT